MQPKTFKGVYREGGLAVHYARLTADNGSGAATGEIGEGKYLQIVDITSITMTVIEKLTGTVIVAPVSLTVSSVVSDTVVTSTAVWTKGGGYNFRHAMPAGSFPESGVIYRTQYKIVVPGGYDPLFLIFEGPAWQTD
jgi:hypothetical protein